MEAISTYFNAERAESLLFTAVLDLVAMRRGDVYLDWLLLQA